MAPETNNTIDWHARLGHLQVRDIMRLHEGLAKGLNQKPKGDLACETCIIVNQTRKSFKHIEGRRAKNRLELLHTDLCGAMPVESIGGAKYLLTIVDDFSRWLEIWPIKDKTQVKDRMEATIERWENLLNTRVKTIRSDTGKEYTNHEMIKWLEKKGIAHQLTNPYTPEQNGVAERFNRTLLGKVRAIMKDANVPLKLWAEAASTAAYLINRSPTNSNENRSTPFELWTERVPTLSHLRTFGCTAYAHVPKQKRGKFDDRGKGLIFVGYPTGVKGYRLLNPEDNYKLIISKSVKFDERNFYCKTKITDSYNKQSKDKDLFQVQIREQTNDEPPENEHRREDSTDDDNEESPYHIKRELPKHSLKPPDRYGYANAMVTSHEPLNYEEAMQTPDAENWQSAMKRELKSLEEANTFEFIAKPKGVTPLRPKWVYKIKKGPHGLIYKARLTVKGCAQVAGRDFTETYSPTASKGALRFFCAIAAKQALDLNQYDLPKRLPKRTSRGGYLHVPT